jgi:hypothetical protein
MCLNIANNAMPFNDFEDVADRSAITAQSIASIVTLTEIHQMRSGSAPARRHRGREKKSGSAYGRPMVATLSKKKKNVEIPDR